VLASPMSSLNWWDSHRICARCWYNACIPDVPRHTSSVVFCKEGQTMLSQLFKWKPILARQTSCPHLRMALSGTFWLLDGGMLCDRDGGHHEIGGGIESKGGSAPLRQLSKVGQKDHVCKVADVADRLVPQRHENLGRITSFSDWSGRTFSALKGYCVDRWLI